MPNFSISFSTSSWQFSSLDSRSICHIDLGTGKSTCWVCVISAVFFPSRRWTTRWRRQRQPSLRQQVAAAPHWARGQGLRGGQGDQAGQGGLLAGPDPWPGGVRRPRCGGPTDREPKASSRLSPPQSPPTAGVFCPFLAGKNLLECRLE